ncbi:MAG TPA: methylmalonyl Co-A mutase-associated GTPase MeaB [Thermoplasmata archaeon]|nr:methylmalonyl Co-A mutase-associated GTPase MeaB [Thermoplasmata archaeon]
MTRAAALPERARAIVRGDRAALARAISDVENGAPAAEPILRALYARTRGVPVVGLAGPLGVGKSSLVNALVGLLRTAGKTVGVVAVDPSSPFSGGSVLGDRIRLDRPADDEGVFFRSMASRGAAGGIAATSREVVRLLDAAGFDVILVETVGSGQVDIAIRDVATTRVVVLVPHLGDEVQTLKAGLFEIADVFCVNKSDLPGADHAERDLAELAALGPAPDGWRARIVRTSTVTPVGIDRLWAAIAAHEEFLDSSGTRAAAERRRLAREIVDRASDRLAHDLTERIERDPALRRLVDRVVARSLDPRSAAARLLAARSRR